MTPEKIINIASALGEESKSCAFWFRDELIEIAQAIAAAARAEAIEECVAICDAYAIDRWNLYKGRAPYTGREPERADSYTQGLSDGAEICSGKIEALLNTGEKT